MPIVQNLLQHPIWYVTLKHWKEIRVQILRSVCVLVLTLALSCVVRAETFSWEASSSLRSLRI